MTISSRCTAALGIGLLFSLLGGASATPLSPFETANLQPLILPFGTPPIGSATLLAPGHARFGVSYQRANTYTTSRVSNPTEQLIIDAEVTRYSFAYDVGLSGLELGVDIPYFTYDGGGLDALIDSWHSLFQQPDRGRLAAPRDRLLVRYERDGETEVAKELPTAGLGDLAVRAGWPLLKGATPRDPALAVRAWLQLPTGDASALHGSDGVDGALWLSGSGDLAGLPLMVAGGVQFTGETRYLEAQRKPTVLFGLIGAGVPLTPRITAKAQLYFNSPYYGESEERQLAGWASEATFGLTIELKSGIAVDVAITEDLVSGASPDVGFLVAVRKR